MPDQTILRTMVRERRAQAHGRISEAISETLGTDDELSLLMATAALSVLEAHFQALDNLEPYTQAMRDHVNEGR